jgi:hypothetical protein
MEKKKNTGEKIQIKQDLASTDVDRILNCNHEWAVFSATYGELCLLVECVECGAYGTVDDPSEKEWDEWYASGKPYGWSDKSRVTVRGIPRFRHVLQADPGNEQK